MRERETSGFSHVQSSASSLTSSHHHFSKQTDLRITHYCTQMNLNMLSVMFPSQNMTDERTERNIEFRDCVFNWILTKEKSHKNEMKWKVLLTSRASHNLFWWSLIRDTWWSNDVCDKPTWLTHKNRIFQDFLCFPVKSDFVRFGIKASFSEMWLIRISEENRDCKDINIGACWDMCVADGIIEKTLNGLISELKNSGVMETFPVFEEYFMFHVLVGLHTINIKCPD